MVNVIGVVQVRLGSSRLPKKVMAEIQGRSMAWHIVSRLRNARLLKNVVIAVPDGEADEPIRRMARDELIPYSAGSEADLIDRIYKAALAFNADAIVRITGDCPLVDPETVDLIVRTYLDRVEELDYVSNVRPPTFPHGLDTEIYPTATLERLWRETKDPYYREWFPVYLWEHEKDFRTYNLEHEENLTHLRWTVDYEDDLVFVREVYQRLYSDGEVFGMQDVLRVLRDEPHLKYINAAHTRQAGNARSTEVESATSGGKGGIR